MEGLDKLFASTPFLSIMKLPSVVSMALRLGLFCFDINAVCLHTVPNPDEPPFSCGPRRSTTHERPSCGGLSELSMDFGALREIGRNTSPLKW